MTKIWIMAEKLHKPGNFCQSNDVDLLESELSRNRAF